MPSSNSLLNNRSFNKLAVNRLDAQKIRSNNISSYTPSYLFSAVFNGDFIRNETGGLLILNESDIDSIIEFSDRPFRQTKYISFNNFISLFYIRDNLNTFSEDPPNVVIVHENEQRTYVMKIMYDNINTNTVIFKVELLPGETHNLGNINGRISLFIDPLSLAAQNYNPSNYKHLGRFPKEIKAGSDVKTTLKTLGTNLVKKDAEVDGGIELAGGGPEDPIADVASASYDIGSGLVSLFKTIRL